MSDSSSDETDVCLRDLLGGVCFDGVDWKEANEYNNDDVQKLTPGLVKAPKGKPSMPRNVIVVYSNDGNDEKKSEEDPTIFSNAYRCTPDGRIERPPVRVVHVGGTSNNNNHNNLSKGNGLVATQFIPRGTVIYTEQAATATQPLPPTLLETSSSHNQEKNSSMIVQACQNCCRSLEPISKLLSNNKTHVGGDSDDSRVSSLLPHPELWPILPLDFVERKTDKNDEVADDENNNNNKKLVWDKYGRVKCTTCHTLFCSTSCRSCFHETYGSCCAWTRTQQACILASSSSSSSFGTDPPIILGTRLFCHMLHYYRKHRNDPGVGVGSEDGTSPLAGHFLSGFCGTHDNLNALELGEYIRQPQPQPQKEQNAIDSGRDYYTLQSLYERLQTILELSTYDERKIFDLCLLHTAVAKAARNGFGIRTQSPFKSYYAGLLRQSGGQRDSPKHRANMKRVIRAIFSSSISSSSSLDNKDDNKDEDYKLERGMDRIIEQMVAPEVCAVFSLTARCNHACVPNAYVCSQEYVDARIDVIAQRDIAVGEEIVISYIGTGGVAGMGKKSTGQRQRALWARYLFHCDCAECRSNAVV